MSNLLQEEWSVECPICKHYFEINAGDYQFEEISAEERGMGVERCYESDEVEIECPICHKKFSRILLYEYPENSKNLAMIEDEIEQ